MKSKQLMICTTILLFLALGGVNCDFDLVGIETDTEIDTILPYLVKYSDFPIIGFPDHTFGYAYATLPQADPVSGDQYAAPWDEAQALFTFIKEGSKEFTETRIPFPKDCISTIGACKINDDSMLVMGTESYTCNPITYATTLLGCIVKSDGTMGNVFEISSIVDYPDVEKGVCHQISEDEVVITYSGVQKDILAAAETASNDSYTIESAKIEEHKLTCQGMGVSPPQDEDCAWELIGKLSDEAFNEIYQFDVLMTKMDISNPGVFTSTVSIDEVSTQNNGWNRISQKNEDTLQLIYQTKYTASGGDLITDLYVQQIDLNSDVGSYRRLQLANAAIKIEGDVRDAKMFPKIVNIDDGSERYIVSYTSMNKDWTEGHIIFQVYDKDNNKICSSEYPGYYGDVNLGKQTAFMFFMEKLSTTVLYSKVYAVEYSLYTCEYIGDKVEMNGGNPAKMFMAYSKGTDTVLGMTRIEEDPSSNYHAKIFYSELKVLECDNYCNTCEDVSAKCTSCVPGREFDAATNTCNECKFGYSEVDGLYICEQFECHYSCETCSASGYKNCSSCPAGRVKFEDTNKCYCQQGYRDIGQTECEKIQNWEQSFETGNPNNDLDLDGNGIPDIIDATMCPEGCKICNENQECMDCQEKKNEFWHNGDCIPCYIYQGTCVAKCPKHLRFTNEETRECEDDEGFTTFQIILLVVIALLVVLALTMGIVSQFFKIKLPSSEEEKAQKKVQPSEVGQESQQEENAKDVESPVENIQSQISHNMDSSANVFANVNNNSVIN